MLSANDLRNGTLFVWEDAPWVVLKYEHMFKGRGRGKISVRARNLKNNSVRGLSFQSSDRLEEAAVEKKKMTFRYRSREEALFEDSSGEEVAIPLPMVEREVQFLTKSQEIWVLFFDGQPIGVQLPPTVTLAVKTAEPGVRGDSVSNLLKPVTLSSGLQTKVPLFINEGDLVVVDTGTGEYRGRA